MAVHRFLVTAPEKAKWHMWMATTAYANWLDGRENKHGSETWLITVLAKHGEHFLEAARATAVTVEEIKGADETERYLLRVGEPGTGWTP